MTDASKIEDISCPVCGYYCLGKGSHGGIDKPFLLSERNQMTPTQIVDKILPEKKSCPSCNSLSLEGQRDSAQYYLCHKCKNRFSGIEIDIFSATVSNLRQRLLDTYGKEWVALPDKWWLKDIITNAWYDQLWSGINRGQSAELIAESILKGLKK